MLPTHPFFSHLSTVRMMPWALALALVVSLIPMTSTPAEACMNRSCETLCLAPCSGNDCYIGGRIRCSLCEGEGDGFFDFIMPQEPATDAVFLNDRAVRLKIRGFQSMPLDPGAHCVTAFPRLRSIESIDAMTSFDSRTGMPIADLDTFASDVAGLVVPDLATKTGVPSSTEPWFAFRSNVLDTIEAGIPSYFVVDLTLKPGVDAETFMVELQQSGALMTSEADDAGMPVGSTVFRQIGFGPLAARTPSAIEPTVPGHPGTEAKPAEF